ncbi:MAG: LacI family DNA-binding transcriptional regulator [Bifidobacterium sp.]|nr:LacI family DNA-binding transcriptional regulator [Bifidobacterium sp.]
MGDKKITIRDIASRAGVSRATVSRYLNGGHWVSDEANRKIRKVIEQTGYVANKSARSLATGRSNSVAFLLGEPQELLFDDPNFSTLLRAIADELGHKEMSLIMMTTDNEAENKRNLKFLHGSPVDGVLLVAWHRGVHKGLLRSLRQINMPVVVAEYPPIDASLTSYVHVDDYQGAAQAAQYLVERGARHIGMLSGPEGPSGTLARIHGFNDMLESLGHKAIGIEHGVYDKQSGYEATLKMIRHEPKIDGLFAASDLMAAGAIQAFRQQGLIVPDDVQVIGFDDQAVARICEPPLTTIHQPFNTIGKYMVDQLIDLIHGGAPTGTTLPLKLVVRQSTR